jgi:hypothetical protein
MAGTCYFDPRPLRSGLSKTVLNDASHVSGIQAFGTLLAFELYRIAFIERLVSAFLNGGKMDEHIFTA